MEFKRIILEQSTLQFLAFATASKIAFAVKRFVNLLKAFGALKIKFNFVGIVQLSNSETLSEVLRKLNTIFIQGPPNNSNKF